MPDERRQRPRRSAMTFGAMIFQAAEALPGGRRPRNLGAILRIARNKEPVSDGP